MFARSFGCGRNYLSTRRVQIPRQSAFEEYRSELLRAFRTGASIELAAEQAGVSVNTLRRWLTNGRNHPDGLYGQFARQVDKIRSGEQSMVWLARDFVDAVRLSFQSDDHGPRLQDVYKRVSGLKSPERGRLELELAQHLLIAILKIYPQETVSEAGLDACYEVFWDFVDDYYAHQEAKGLR